MKMERHIMQFVRPFDDSEAFDTGFPGYRAQFVSKLESALLIHSVIQENGCGPDLHYHHSDQMYFMLEGGTKVQLGDDVREAKALSLVFIPAGLPHRNWNDGPGQERHFEMIIPAPFPGAPIAHMVESAGDVPAERRAIRPGYVRQVESSHLHEALPGFRMQALADPGSGSAHAVMNYAEVDAGAAGPGMHIHGFDQYYMVVSGELTVEIALETHVAGPNTLVVIPAGVPHRQYNDGSTTESHLVINTPTPLPGQPWDQGVEFGANGETHAGPNDLVMAEEQETRG
jgi:mannose-6-phosphate isomerase-like protein (cupin superfamily)